MGLKKEYEDTLSSIKYVLKSNKYRLISLIFGIVVFGFLYYFLVAKVADNSIWISVMMSGPGFITFSILTIFLTASLSGVLLGMLVFKFDSSAKAGDKGIFGFVGSGIAAFGVGCPTCGAFLFGLIGMPLALLYFPFHGLELQVLGIFVLLASVYLAGKSIRGYCKIG